MVSLQTRFFVFFFRFCFVRICSEEYKSDLFKQTQQKKKIKGFVQLVSLISQMESRINICINISLCENERKKIIFTWNETV